MLAISATAFDHTAFVTQTREFAYLATGYADLGLDTTAAVAWAGYGFTPDETLPWLAEGFTPEEARHHNDCFRCPVEAARINRLRTANWPGYRY